PGPRLGPNPSSREPTRLAFALSRVQRSDAGNSCSPGRTQGEGAVVADCKGTLAGSFEFAIAGANAAFFELRGARPRSPSKPSAGVVGGSGGGATLPFT